HARFVELLDGEGVQLDDVRYCPHAPEEGCTCRKPAPTLMVDAATQLGLDLEGSFAIGDQPRDLESARAAGCRTLVLLGAEQDARLDASIRPARNWDEAQDIVLEALDTA
ncbi:MAG TPA: HAD hydrolase-like protein, partial [Gaiellaceae bacterium]|nr:HAD hydrolase-like protein [Gaiellaceae bacterium]